MRALYTITNSTGQVRYAGNGVTTAFPVTFQFFEADTIRVQTVVDEVATLQVLNVDYTVSGGAGETGSVTITPAPPSGTTIVIDLDMPFTQETIDLAPNGPLPAEDVEQGFDRIVTTVKQLRQQLLSVPTLDASFNPDSDDPPTLPPPASGQVLIGNTDGTGWDNAIAVSGDLPVVLTGEAAGDPLVFDGAVWRNNLHVGSNRITNIIGGIGAMSRFLNEKIQELPITPVDFGAVDISGGGSTDSADAYDEWWDFMQLVRPWGHLPTGRFRSSRQLDFNLDAGVPLVNYGLQITSAGARNSVIVFDTGVTSPCLTIRCSGAANASFYAHFLGVGVEGETAGKLVMIGDAGLVGAFNTCTFDINALNGSTDPAAIGIEFNYIVSSKLRYTSNVADTSQGTAVKMNQCHGLLVLQGQHGNAGIGLHMTGITYGNLFLGSLFEVLGKGIVTDSVNTFTNSFRGGLISQNGSFISSTNGSNNVIDAMTWDGLGNFFDGSNYTGWTLQNQRNSLLTVPSVGTSPWSWTNNCGQAVMAYLTGGIVSAIVVNGSTLQQATECAVMVPPGQVLQVTHTSTPGLSMQVVQ